MKRTAFATVLLLLTNQYQQASAVSLSHQKDTSLLLLKNNILLQTKDDSIDMIETGEEETKAKKKKDDDEDDLNVDATSADNTSGDVMQYMQSDIKATGIADKAMKKSKEGQEEEKSDELTERKKQEQMEILRKEIQKKPTPPAPQFTANNPDGIVLRNINDQQFVGQVLMGSPPQMMPVMFDTGSSIMYMMSKKCARGCPERLEKYDQDLSGTFQLFQKQRQDQNYGQGFVTGSMAQDAVCFTNVVDNCDQFKFLLVDGGSDLQKDQFSGIIGLSPPSTEEKSLVPPFISQLNQMFSFYLSKGAGSEGFLKVGGYDLEKYAKPGAAPSDIVWTSVVDDGWTIPLSSLKFKNGKEIELKSEQITMDTGLSYALVPPRDIESIIDVVKQDQNMTCAKEGNYDLDLFQCNCTKQMYDKLAPLQLNINGKFFELPVSAWMSFDEKRKTEEEPDKPLCQILLHPYDISMTATYRWVMGIQFLQHFYSIFDWKNKKVGLIEAKKMD